MKKARFAKNRAFAFADAIRRAGKLLLDLGDGAGGAGLLASAAGNAGILVGHGSNVVELENALGAGVNANAAGDALVSINDRLSHGRILSVRYTTCTRRHRRMRAEFCCA